MNPWNELYARVIWPALDPTGYAGLRRHLRDFARMETASPQAIQDRQWQSLRRLVRHAWDTCPFYRQRFDDAGLGPDLRHPDDLSRLPVLTRDELRQQGTRIQSTAFPPDQLQPSMTGGTTDSPVPFVRNRACLPLKHAVQEGLHLWAGLRPGDRIFQLWGARVDFPEHLSWRYRFKQRHLMREVMAPSSHLNPETMERYRLELNRLKPRALRAYPTPLSVFTDFLAHCGRPYHRPQTIIVTAEMLLPSLRAGIEKTFDCPVFDHYGSREIGMVAGECERHTGLHYNPLAAYMELAPVAGETGVREMLITDLLNYGMPFIRYRINDCVAGQAAACGCGRSFPVLPPIVGRAADVFRLADGTVVPGVTIANRIIQGAAGIVKAQVIQETLRDFRIRYVPRPDVAHADFQPIRQKMAEFLGPGLQVTFEPVAEIPREANGKTRFVISRVTAPGR